MTKYSEETKRRFIDLITNNNYSITSAASELEISKSLGKRWWKMYEHHGCKGLIMKSGTYTGEFKIYAVEYMHSNHLSISEALALLGIPSKSVLLKWERKYYEEGSEGLLLEQRGRSRKSISLKPNIPLKKELSKETEEDLIAEVQRLRAEVAYLKNTTPWFKKRSAQEQRKSKGSS